MQNHSFVHASIKDGDLLKNIEELRKSQQKNKEENLRNVEQLTANIRKI